MIHWTILLVITIAFVLEACAHSLIIKGLTKCGQNRFENDLWHWAFFGMWSLLALTILLLDWNSWKVVIFLATSRLFVFPTVLNWLRGKPFDYLSDNGIDGLMKKAGEETIFFVRAVLWVASILYIVL